MPFNFLIAQCVFPKNKDILLGNHSTIIKFQEFNIGKYFSLHIGKYFSLLNSSPVDLIISCI